MAGVVGVVPMGGRETLALQPLDGAPLLVRAVRSLLTATGRATTVVARDPAEAADVLGRFGLGHVHVAATDELGARLDRSQPPGLLVHDPMCPLVPAAELVGMRRRAEAGDAAAGVVAVTDTIKRVRRDAGRTVVDRTVERSLLRSLTSPVCVPISAVAELRRRLGDETWLDDLVAAVGALRAVGEVTLVEMRPLGPRVEDGDSLRLSECVDAVRQRGHPR